MRSIIYSNLVASASGAFDSPGPSSVTTWGSANPSGATYMAFRGNINSVDTLVQCAWSGSEAGILDLASNSIVQENFLVSGDIDGMLHTGLPSSFTPATVDLAMADNIEADSVEARKITDFPIINSQTPVAVIPFVFVRNPGVWNGVSASGCTNNVDCIAVQQTLDTLSQGAVQAVFTGVATDTTNYVYVSGRDQFSGTRANAFGGDVTGFGVQNIPFQVELSGSTLTGGNNLGFSSGGTLANSLGASTASFTDTVHTGLTGFTIIAYLGIADAKTATNNGAILCSLNGVPESTANVEEGAYDFWGNEILMEANGDTAGSALHTAIANTVASFCDDVTAIALPHMHTSKPNVDTRPTHN
jgi:hypothetical protein